MCELALIIEGIFALFLGAWIGRSGRRIQHHYHEVPPDFVHKDFVADPTHFDEMGRYKFWGD